MKIRNIKCYSEERMLFEGQVLVQEDGSFEGIVSNPLSSELVNSYVSGCVNKDNMEFTLVKPEEQESPEHFLIFKDDETREWNGEAENHKNCRVYLTSLVVSNDMKTVKMNDLSVILEAHKSTMSERSCEDALSLANIKDEEQKVVLERTLRASHKLNYYL